MEASQENLYVDDGTERVKTDEHCTLRTGTKSPSKSKVHLRKQGKLGRDQL